MEEKRRVHFRKIKGLLGKAERQLVEVSKEINRTRRRLKREYFDQRMGKIRGDLRAT